MKPYFFNSDIEAPFVAPIFSEKLLYKEISSSFDSVTTCLLLFPFGVESKRSLTLEEIGKFFKQFYGDKLHGKDLNDKKHIDWKSWDLKNFMTLAKTNPIKFLIKDEQNIEFFEYKNNIFYLNEKLYNEIDNNSTLLKNILDRLKYRNINYFNRKYMEEK
ncbi:hypothetical protein [Cetobacterium sp.]|uniref:hypothetical protein n=1 Tax=Cetobacterium sp. TaxID=2071632 RepID=UPI003F3382EC